MNKDDIALAFELFDRVRAAPPEERGRLMNGGSGINTEVEGYVRSLLDHDSPTGQFLGSPVGLVSAGLASHMDVARVPERIGPYRVVRIIGRGGFGTVFQAQEPRTKRYVAVKLMRPVFSETERRRMEFEAEAMGRLEHEGIARILACGTAEESMGAIYIAMEYIDGPPIHEYVRERGLSVPERIRLVVKAARAVAHAHQNGLIHRDLSPRNILVNSAGQPKVVDFGLASRSDRDSVASARLTATGDVMGTLRYMSPEQVTGARQSIDTRADTFALGVIAFELLTGMHPYMTDTSTIGGMLAQLASASQLRASAVRRELRGDIDAVLAKSVEREPGRRYQSATAFADDLERVLARQPVVARRPGVLYIARKFAERHRVGVATGCAVLGVVAAAIVYSGVAVTRELEARGSAVAALDAVISQVLTPLAPRVGTWKERSNLLESIGPEVERMARQLPDNARVQRIHARYLAALARSLQERGRADAALPLQVKAVDSYASMYDRNRLSADIGHEYSMAIVKLGDLEKDLGRPDASLELYRRALALDEKLVAAAPLSVPLLSNLFWSYTRFEHDAIMNGRGDEEVWRRRAVSTAEEMLRLEPQGWRSLEAAAFAQSRLALAAGDPETALPFALAAVEHARQLAASDPSIGQNQGLLVIHCNLATGFAVGTCRIDLAESLLSTADAAAVFLLPDADDPHVERSYLRGLRRKHLDVARAKGDTKAAIDWTWQLVRGLDWQLSHGNGGREELIMKGEQLASLCETLSPLGPNEELATSKQMLSSVSEALARRYPDDARCRQLVAEWERVLADSAG